MYEDMFGFEGSSRFGVDYTDPHDSEAREIGELAADIRFALHNPAVLGPEAEFLTPRDIQYAAMAAYVGDGYIWPVQCPNEVDSDDFDEAIEVSEAYDGPFFGHCVRALRLIGAHEYADGLQNYSRGVVPREWYPNYTDLMQRAALALRDQRSDPEYTEACGELVGKARIHDSIQLSEPADPIMLPYSALDVTWAEPGHLTGELFTGLRFRTQFPEHGLVYIPGAGISPAYEITRLAYGKAEIMLNDENPFSIRVVKETIARCGIENITVNLGDFGKQSPAPDSVGAMVLSFTHKAPRESLAALVKKAADFMASGGKVVTFFPGKGIPNLDYVTHSELRKLLEGEGFVMEERSVVRTHIPEPGTDPLLTPLETLVARQKTGNSVRLDAFLSVYRVP